MAGMASEVLAMRSAGMPFAVIADKLDSTEDACRASYQEELDDVDLRFDVALTIHRIDKLLSVAWGKASDGDLAAMDRVLALEQRRERLLGWTREQKHEMREAFDQTVESLGVDVKLYAAAIASGRVIADRIDAALCMDDRTEVTKSMYLVPHLINVLRELGATPAQVSDVKAKAAEAKPEGGAAKNGTAARRNRAKERFQVVAG